MIIELIEKLNEKYFLDKFTFGQMCEFIDFIQPLKEKISKDENLTEDEKDYLNKMLKNIEQDLDFNLKMDEIFIQINTGNKRGVTVTANKTGIKFLSDKKFNKQIHKDVLMHFQTISDTQYKYDTLCNLILLKNSLKALEFKQYIKSLGVC